MGDRSVIWKFPLLITDEQVLMMPGSAFLLHVAFQGDTLCLWAQVDPQAPPTGQTVHIYGTGHPIDVPLSDEYHIGTAQHVVNGVTLVWHVFAVCPMPAGVA